jgi:hypothetical protein
MNQESTKKSPNDILEEYGLEGYHEYLVTGKIPERNRNDKLLQTGKAPEDLDGEY